MADGDTGFSGQRIDVWLCNARIVKSRTLAQELLDKGKVRVNRVRVGKASHVLRTGDAITISLGPRVRVLKVEGFALRRGPAAAAQKLYAELTAGHEPAKAESAGGAAAMLAQPSVQAVRERSAGRPTKRDRRILDRLRGRTG